MISINSLLNLWGDYMFTATVYIERDGKIEKLSASFETKSERNDWLLQKLAEETFDYLIVNGQPVPV